MANPNFAWDRKLQRYRYTSGRNKGNFVKETTVRSTTRRYLKKQGEKASTETDKLFKGKKTLRDWEIEQAKNIKSLALQVFKINNPELGQSRQDQSDYGFIGAYLKQQYIYLRNFTTQIRDGELSEAQIKARLQLYYENLNYLSEESKRKSHTRNGYSWERRLLSSSEHCEDCVRYAGLGWQSVGTLPPIATRCACKANCKCYFEYSKSNTKPVEMAFINFKYGWLNATQRIY